MAKGTPGKFGTFHLVRKLGEGAMGEVYEAYREGEDTHYALKILSKELSSQEDKVERFRREMLAVEKLDHENIVKAYDFGTAQDRYYFLMDFIDGESMDRIILRTGISVVNSVKYAIQSARALDHAHQRGVVHRDVKPSNFMVDKESRIFLTDFGIARDEATMGLTAAGQVMGTPNYMSPEQARGRTAEIDGRTDLYSLAASFYEMLTRAVPFTAENPNAILKKVCDDDPLPPSRINGRVPKALELVVLKGLRKSPAKRYQTGEEFAKDLERWQEGKPVRARAETPMEKAAKFVRRHRSFSLMAGVFLFLVTVVTVGLVLYSNTQEAARVAEAQKLAKKVKGLVTKGQSLLAKGKTKEAKRKFLKALDLDEEDVDAAIGIDQVDEAQKEAKEKKELRKVQAKARAMAKKALTFADKGDGIFKRKVEVVTQVRSLLAQKGDNYEGLDLQKLVLERKEIDIQGNVEYNTALKELGNALLLDPECRAAHQGIARIYLNLAKLHLFEAADTGDYNAVQADIMLVERHDRAKDFAGDVKALRKALTWTATLTFGVTPARAKISLITCNLEAGTASKPREVGHNDLTLPAGSYIILMEDEGYIPARVPVHLTRPITSGDTGIREIMVELYPEAQHLEGMVFVPKGAFWWGGKVGVRGGKKQHGSLPAFFIDRCEVTNAAYKEFFDHVRKTRETKYFPDTTPEKVKKMVRPAFWEEEAYNKPDQPIVGISWYEAAAYAKWKGLRLPTSFEFEKAARGVDGRSYPWGNRFDETRCVHERNPEKNHLWAVGSIPEGVSPFGAMDMAGNVAEWTKDLAFAGTTYNYNLGGSYLDSVDFLRPPSRDMTHRTSRVKYIGFRCACDAK